MAKDVYELIRQRKAYVQQGLEEVYQHHDKVLWTGRPEEADYWFSVLGLVDKCRLHPSEAVKLMEANGIESPSVRKYKFPETQEMKEPVNS